MTSERLSNITRSTLNWKGRSWKIRFRWFRWWTWQSTWNGRIKD